MTHSHHSWGTSNQILMVAIHWHVKKDVHIIIFFFGIKVELIIFFNSNIQIIYLLFLSMCQHLLVVRMVAATMKSLPNLVESSLVEMGLLLLRQAPSPSRLQIHFTNPSLFLLLSNCKSKVCCFSKAEVIARRL
jgi:hypothetical protein